MTLIEAFVWCFGIMVAGITISSVAASFSKAFRTIKITREEGTNENETDSSGG